MNSFITFTLLLLATLAASAPASENLPSETIIVTKDFFPDILVKYKSQYDIVDIVVPINAININDNDSSSSEESDDLDVTFFFIEADLSTDGKRVDKGLYVFKKNTAKKLLDNGRTAAASADNNTQVFLGAQDGIYVYTPETNEAVKYGSLTDSIIGMAKTSDDFYILTEDNVLYKVTDEGNTKTKVDQVVNAKQIVVDYSNNLYFYSDDKVPYVLTADGVKKIEGLPENPATVTLIKPPFIVEDSVPFIVDNRAYFIYANGSSEFSEFEFQPKYKPTAFAMEGTLVQYYAHNKKIYEYNILTMVFGEILGELKPYLESKKEDIHTLASKKHIKKP